MKVGALALVLICGGALSPGRLLLLLRKLNCW